MVKDAKQLNFIYKTSEVVAKLFLCYALTAQRSLNFVKMEGVVMKAKVLLNN